MIIRFKSYKTDAQKLRKTRKAGEYRSNQVKLRIREHLIQNLFRRYN